MEKNSQTNPWQEKFWHSYSMEEAIEFYTELHDNAAESKERTHDVRRNLILNDLFYLLVYGCGRRDMLHPWIYARCREVEANPNGYLDLWAREHYKSTIITFGKTIQDILNDPNITVGIFSFNRPIAKGFLRQIKNEFEQNTLLKDLFKDILYEKPGSQAPKWSEDDGITVKRSDRAKEATVEAWGLVDGQPTSKHFRLRVYDDVVTRENVTTPEMIKKTTEAWELSDNLGTEGGLVRTIGTRYHLFDTYHHMMKRGVVKVREYPCTSDGSEDFEKAVLLQPETLREKRKTQGPHTFGAQMLLNPKTDKAVAFDAKWLRFWYANSRQNLNVTIIVDPASGKSKNQSKLRRRDFTVMWVVGRGGDDNWYILDVIRDKLSLPKREKVLTALVRMYKPYNNTVFYEQEGMQADIEHIEYVMEQSNFRYKIREISSGGVSKFDRIQRLIPLFENERIYLPHKRLLTNWENQRVDVIQDFINEEYNAFPVLDHDDMLDSLSNVDNEEVKRLIPVPEFKDEGWSATNAARKMIRQQRRAGISQPV